MTDNTVLPTSDAGGDTIALDDIGGVKYPRSKIVIGADGTNDGDVSSANPLPISGPVTNAGTFAVQVTSAPSTAVTGPLTDTELRASAVPVSVATIPSHAVTNAGTFAVQASQTGSWTVDLGATDNAVLDAIAASVAGTLTVGLPTGASTASNQTTLIGHVDGIEALLTTISADTTKLAAVSFASLGVEGGGVEATALRVTIASDSTGVLSVDDNGSSLTVDGTVTANLSATDNAVLDAIAASVADPSGRYDIFGKAVTTSSKNSIDVQFFRGAPETLVTVTTANSATAASNVGGALFASGTNTSGSVQGVTAQNTIYRSGSEVYAMFTASFTAGVASSYMRIGLYDANNGFFVGYEGTSFGLTVRNNAADVTTAKGSWSEDSLTGAAGSKFTRAGVPEAIDLTKLNIWRIRFGWLGSAPFILEVMAPDGHWVTCHKVLYPNLQATPSIRSADLPITLDITKTSAGATDLQIQTDCWGAGTNSGVGNLGDIYAFQTTALLNNGATFSSGVKTLSPEYSQVQTTILASHNGSIDIYWYQDRAGTDLVRTLTIPYVAANGFQLYSAPAFTPYVKYEFTNNSGSNQTDFHFDTKFLHQPLSPQVLRVDGTLLGGMVATVQKAVIAGETTGGGGGYVNVKVSPSGAVNVAAAQDGTWDIGTVTTLTTCATVSTLTGSSIAHDAADSGNPHKIGAKATTALSGVTLVADADRTDLRAGVDGVLITRPHCNLEDIVQEQADNTDGASTAFTSGLAAPGAGVRLWICGVIITNSSASDVTVSLRDGVAGSVLAKFSAPGGGGSNYTFGVPLRVSANTALAFDSSAAVTTLSVTANGFKSKV